jgi:hypothetical protein
VIKKERIEDQERIEQNEAEKKESAGAEGSWQGKEDEIWSKKKKKKKKKKR